MEVLQCDGCHFRADSYDDLKAHIQDVHTAFLQPTAVGDRSPEHSGSNSLNSFHQTEDDEQAELHSLDLDPEPFTGSSQTTHKRSVNQPSRSTTQFFQCKFCVRYFRSKSLLNDHTKRVHAVVSTASEGSSSPPQTSKQTSYSILMHDGMRKVFSCQYCTYKSPRRARILKHQKMFHKYMPLDSPDNELATNSVMLPTQEASLELPEEVVQRSILESMVKPLTKSRGNFSCEWCGYQTLRRERWCDHMMKKHRNMVKIISSIQDGDTSIDSSKTSSLHSPSSSPNSGLPSNSFNGKDVSSVDTGFMGSSESAARSTPGQGDDFSSYEYSQKKSKIANSTGTSTLSERPTFVMSDVSNSGVDFEKRSLPGSSSDDEAEDMDDTLAHLSDDSKKQLLSDEEYKMLETKGIPFKKHMNRFQCPFCSFLTVHRQSISRHIEKIHLSGKKTLYKCDKCPFICTNPLRLGTHKQCHVETSSEWENMDDSLYIQDEEPMNGGNVSSKVSSKKSCGVAVIDPEKSYHCSLCSYSTTTLKGLRVHQQHKHSYCDNMKADTLDGSPNEQLDSEHEIYSSSSYVKKTQTSILGFSSKKLVNKSARKSINDSPLDLSPVKKRTRIDEIANNLQSKISQSSQKEEAIINLEEIDDEEEEEENGENETDEDKVDIEVTQLSKKHCISRPRRKYSREMKDTQEEGRQKLFLHEKLKSSNTLIQLTISDDDDNENECASSAGSKSLLDQAEKDSGGEAFRHGSDYSDDTATLFYCKHCEYQNKSARSVSTHYQRMHPYIKFNFRYILDPEDQSAVFRCLECFVEYTTFDDLNQHYVEHHPEAMNVLNFNQPDLVYKCRFCLYTSPNVRSLMPHYQRMHPTVKINNAMIFSSYVVEPRHKDSIESQTLREILNSGPKNFSNSSSGSRSSVQFSPVHKNSKSQEYHTETEVMKESVVNNVVVYDCDICSFASPNMHSVLVHYQKKHPEQKASYFRIQKTMRIVSVDRAQASNNDTPDASASNSLKTSNVIPMGMDEDIYYCKHCVYSNRSVVGVLVHYQKRHPEIKVTAKYIKHAPPTSGLMKLMEELQIAPPKQFLKSASNNGVGNSSHTKSGGDKGEVEMLYFCQHCDYGNQTVKGVLIHYQKKHRDVKANADLVRRHTAVVRSQRERAQSNNSSVPAAISDSEATRPLRALKCRHCTYTSPYVYALKKHLKKDHPTVKATAMTILHWAYQDGILEAGYHCEWCIYFHPEPNGLLMHYQKRHPEHNVDYTYMATKLWAGPDTTASQSVGNADSKHYQCKDCAFQACSIWDITNHYQAVHPWAVKGDDSVLLDIIKGNLSSEKRQTSTKEDLSLISGQFNSHACEQGQEPSLDLTGQLTKIVSHQSFPSTSISNNPYQCTVCFSEYNSLHGLLTHYGKKHPGMKVKAADFAQETDINPSSVYKCRHCPYVNSRIHGVLTHYQKRHPQIKVTAEDFADDIEEVIDVNEGEEKYKSQRQGFGAYRCKMCPYTHGTLEKLKIHYEKYHNQPASDMFRPSFADLSSNMDETHVESSLADVEDATDFHAAFSEFSVDKSEKQSFRCQLCKYFCSTRKGIARHYRIKHNNVRAQPEGKNNVFKCALCSYTNPIRKGLAAHYQKRHHIDAYYTHCLAASKTATEKPSKVVVPAAEDQGPMLSEELRAAVEKRKCSLCSFQAFSRKSIVSHYIKRHPGVFPKKQHSSKLGRFFTIVYDKEPENPAEVEEKRATEEPCVTEQEDDSERLPFKCSRCFKLSFNTAELLCMHYTEHHSKDLKRDFATLAGPMGNAADSYQCARCDLEFLSLPELSAHLTSHNEDIRKRVERQERRKKQLLGKQKGAGQLDGTPEKLENHASNVPIGYRCNFCVEVHPTLRAICNHLRKHVQYGETKAGRVKHEVPEIPVSAPADGEPNGDLEEAEPVTLGLSPVSPEAAAAVATDGKPGMPEPEHGSGELVAVRERRVEKHACGQCDRVFMSMQGLRSHERSHSAMAAALSRREDKYICQYCPFSSPFRHNLQRHILSHHRHRKPFLSKSAYLSRFKSHLNKAHPGENTYRCLSCPQSFMTISQLKEHSQEIHGEVLTLPRLRAAAQSTVRPQRPARVGEKLPVTTDSTDATYADPAAAQQQLDRYQETVQAATPSPAPTPADAALTCEFCDFSSGYMQSLRRHYRDRHGGKKLYKCKDCSYFTCYKSAFTMHVESGHTALPVESLRDLHCPLCLYHTKVKSSMIDHIVLHREERVVPLEVSCSKLSQHLQGVVFSCHKCTFTCSGDESLKQHLKKHGELKPYTCQLCFYDSGELEELEAHLRDEHKVICNFELAGRVNLDQLEAVMGKLSSTEEDEEDREEEENEGELEEAEKAEAKDAPGSPGSEKRFPCKFCGRAFTNSAEWERHVLRHGMTVANSKMKVGASSVAEASSQPGLVSLTAKLDRPISSDSMEVDSGSPSEQAKTCTENVEYDETAETKNCP
uniref:Zinc finger protein 462 n=1 Tax=Paramormyrops kingsleyae TaxID=1676925 RepID=A0A3B3RTS1_9TELE|nr:zinc finger protein 462-like isoform X1 [Paramormyrops kingsleyae]XP_023658203.1 zinc finger protein 462-like isoform X1 [Paramormyrops kingsleyae]